ncbi:MAG: glycerol kinase GlpK [Rhodothermales bacterium]|nr:glycerol kinase GlpK [Rhodothermales bacterium]
MKYILSFDQGTTSSRSIIFDHTGAIKSVAQREFRQIFPQSGWVEHDADEIWKTQIGTAREAIENAGLTAGDIAAIGITNQRETTVVWDRESGAPIYNAIVWQDRRTAAFCNQLKESGAGDMARERSGLVLDPYFSGTKVRWILNNVDGARELADRGRLAFGTIDSWLIWNLTGGERHVTDSSNASRTLLYNINDLRWDPDMLELLDVPKSVLPEVRGSSEILGETLPALFGKAIPIGGVAGDQQAALFGQVCTEPGMAKNTYGTGCFMLMNTGSEPVTSENNLLTTIAWTVDGKTEYALEGSVFVGGAVVQWLRDGLGIIQASEEVEALARGVESTDGVYFVPAFTGLGAPHWDPYARGTITGLSRGSTAAHLARAALESIAFQSADVIHAMERDSGIDLKELRVDGGAAANNLLMQFQSDLLQVPVIRPRILETTALGAAYLAGLATGYWDGTDELAAQWKQDRKFEPAMGADRIEELNAGWNDALERSRGQRPSHASENGS